MCFSTWQYCKNALFQNWRENNSRKTFLLISFGLTFNWKMFWNFISGTNTTNAFGLALPCASNTAPNRAFLYLLMELNSRPLFMEATIVQSMMLHPLPKWTNSIKMSFDHEQFCFKVNSWGNYPERFKHISLEEVVWPNG